MSEKPRGYTVVELVERTESPDTHRFIKWDEIRINGQPVTVERGKMMLETVERGGKDVTKITLTLLLDEFHIRPATP